MDANISKKVSKPEIWALMQKPENSFLVELAKAFGAQRIKIGEKEWKQESK